MTQSQSPGVAVEHHMRGWQHCAVLQRHARDAFTVRQDARDMSAEDLSGFVGRFERTAHEVVSGAGARVVKLIGDEVMFVDPDPNAAVEAGRALIDTFSAMGDGVLPRGGMAYGSVVLRGGDYYGSVVNIASRLADAAVPGELLVTTGIADATDCEFEPAGRRMLKGFDEPIAVLALPG